MARKKKEKGEEKEEEERRHMVQTNTCSHIKTFSKR